MDDEVFCADSARGSWGGASDFGGGKDVAGRGGHVVDGDVMDDYGAVDDKIGAEDGDKSAASCGAILRSDICDGGRGDVLSECGHFDGVAIVVGGQRKVGLGTKTEVGALTGHGCGGGADGEAVRLGVDGDLVPCAPIVAVVKGEGPSVGAEGGGLLCGDLVNFGVIDVGARALGEDVGGSAEAAFFVRHFGCDMITSGVVGGDGDAEVFGDFGGVASGGLGVDVDVVNAEVNADGGGGSGRQGEGRGGRRRKEDL